MCLKPDDYCYASRTALSGSSLMLKMWTVGKAVGTSLEGRILALEISQGPCAAILEIDHA